MRTTVEIQDQLFARVQKKAKREGRSMRSVFEEGLRLSLEADLAARGEPYHLPDKSVGEPTALNPLETLTWNEIRDAVYGGR